MNEFDVGCRYSIVSRSCNRKKKINITIYIKFPEFFKLDFKLKNIFI